MIAAPITRMVPAYRVAVFLPRSRECSPQHVIAPCWGFFFRAMKMKISNLYPPSVRDALMLADTWPEGKRIARIDQLTQEAADQYPELIRQPSDDSMVHEWSARRAAWPA